MNNIGNVETSAFTWYIHRMKELVRLAGEQIYVLFMYVCAERAESELRTPPDLDQIVDLQVTWN